MITAVLKLGDAILKIEQYDAPRDNLRYLVQSSYLRQDAWSPTITDLDYQKFFIQEMIFKLDKMVGCDVYEYQYVGVYAPKNQKFIFRIDNFFTGDFQEPDENVNLGKLKKKLRNKKKMRDLLIRYYSV